MKKAFKKLRAKFVNKFKYFLNIIVRILKVIVQVAAICIPMSLALILVNSLLGVHIRFSYYFMMSAIATIGISLILTIINWNKITNVQFVKGNRDTNKKVNKNNTQKDQRRKRRIS